MSEESSKPVPIAVGLLMVNVGMIGVSAALVGTIIATVGSECLPMAPKCDPARAAEFLALAQCLGYAIVSNTVSSLVLQFARPKFRGEQIEENGAPLITVLYIVGAVLILVACWFGLEAAWQVLELTRV